MADRNDHYVYILSREDGVTPFYVGKGHDDRWLDHEKDAKRERSHKAAIIRKIQAAGLAVPKRKAAEGLTNAEACALEVRLIAEIGRAPLGPLVNLTDGGESTPPQPTREQMQAYWESKKGKPLPEATLIAASKAWRGHHHTPETKARMRMSFAAQVTPAYREKLSQALIHWHAARRAAGLSQKGRDWTPESRSKHSQIITGWHAARRAAGLPSTAHDPSTGQFI